MDDDLSFIRLEVATRNLLEWLLRQRKDDFDDSEKDRCDKDEEGHEKPHRNDFV